MKMDPQHLREFFSVPYWWPPHSFEGDTEGLKDHSSGCKFLVPCVGFDEEKAIRLKQVKNSLTSAVFEVVDAGTKSGTPVGTALNAAESSDKHEYTATYETRVSNTSAISDRDPAFQAKQHETKEIHASSLEDSSAPKDAAFSDVGCTPPCFAVFTRFNCNVTLVAQRFFGEPCSVEVLGSRRGIVEASALSILKFWMPWVSPMCQFYARHVVLHFRCMGEKSAVGKKGSFFSYGAVFMNISALPPQMRVHIIDEKLPFGVILDQLGLQRSVSVGMQLHIHLNDDFYLACSNSTVCSTTRVASGPSEDACLNAYTDREMRPAAFREDGPADGPFSGSCTCRLLTAKEHCTFGRVTTIYIEGQPSAFVLEIINAYSVLQHLLSVHPQNVSEKLDAKKECTRFSVHRNAGEQKNSCEHDISGVNDSMRNECTTRMALERLRFLGMRCLCSVYRCPVHCGELPPISELTRSLRSSSTSGGCNLCKSVSCSTNFEAATTHDML